MVCKKGFLLIELLLGFTIAIFLTLLITHYIIEVKKRQHAALKRIEKVTIERNKVEKINKAHR